MMTRYSSVRICEVWLGPAWQCLVGSGVAWPWQDMVWAAQGSESLSVRICRVWQGSAWRGEARLGRARAACGNEILAHADSTVVERNIKGGYRWQI